MKISTKNKLWFYNFKCIFCLFFVFSELALGCTTLFLFFIFLNKIFLMFYVFRFIVIKLFFWLWLFYLQCTMQLDWQPMNCLTMWILTSGSRISFLESFKSTITGTVLGVMHLFCYFRVLFAFRHNFPIKKDM